MAVVALGREQRPHPALEEIQVLTGLRNCDDRWSGRTGRRARGHRERGREHEGGRRDQGGRDPAVHGYVAVLRAVQRAVDRAAGSRTSGCPSGSSAIMRQLQCRTVTFSLPSPQPSPRCRRPRAARPALA